MELLAILLFGVPEPRDINMKASPPYVECWNGDRWSYPPMVFVRTLAPNPSEFGKEICKP